MRENSLYPDIIRGLYAEGHKPYRIHDGTGERNPFDIGGIVAGGRGLAIEVKVDRRASESLGGTIHWPDFEPHQIRWLRAFAEADAVAIAAIYWLAGHRMFVYRLTTSDIDKQLITTESCSQLTHRNHAYSGWQDVIANVSNQ